MRLSHRYALLLTASAAVASCSSEGSECGPTDPGCGPDSTVATIAVTATIDTVMAVGRTTQLSAAAEDADGNPVSVSFSWSSTSAPVATVDGDGTVSAVTVGPASIEASADGAVGQWSFRVVEADLDGVTALLSDPFAEALIGSLDATSASTLDQLAADCDAASAIGDVLLVKACLEDSMDVESPDAGNDPTLGVLDLFFQESLRKLRLDG